MSVADTLAIIISLDCDSDQTGCHPDILSRGVKTRWYPISAPIGNNSRWQITQSITHGLVSSSNLSGSSHSDV